MDVTEAPFGSATQEITLAELGRRMDVLGQQMNWLCENLQSLFAFVQQMSSSGGGIRGLMHAMKQGPPEINNNIPIEDTNKIVNKGA